MLTQSELKELLNYDPDTGIFTWKHKRGLAGKYSVAGVLHHKGYIQIGINYKSYRAHRLAWLYVYGEWPKNQIDHINLNKSDNRIINLRECSISENLCNKPSYKNNTTGIKGVSWCKKDKCFVGSVTLNRKRFYRRFKSLDKAKEIMDSLRKEIHGQFANLDF